MDHTTDNLPVTSPSAIAFKKQIDVLELSLRSMLPSDEQTAKIIAVDAAIVTSMKANIFMLKERFVLEVHKNKISVVIFSQRNKHRYGLVTRLPKAVQTTKSDKLRRSVNIPEGMDIPSDGEIIPELYEPAYREMIEALYDIYSGAAKENEYLVSAVYEKAKARWIKLAIPAHETIRKLDIDYNRFINEDLRNKDIRDITVEYLIDYSKEVIETQELNTKGLFKLFGVFNKIFEYALEEEIIIKDPRPKGVSQTGLKKLCVSDIKRPQDKAFTLEEVALIRKELRNRIKSDNYDYNAYAALFATYTGCRAGEIVGLKWDDIDWSEKAIWIHGQLISEFNGGKTEYHYVPCTKNEKGVSKGGRIFPLLDVLKELLIELKNRQDALGIESEFVFCKEDGSYVTSKGYQSALNKLCKKLGLHATHNHAFRVSINSYSMIAAGIPVTERAQMLGHSVSTNEHFYCYSDPSLERNRDKLNEFFAESDENDEMCNPVCNPKSIKFVQKENLEKCCNYKQFSRLTTTEKEGFEPSRRSPDLHP